MVREFELPASEGPKPKPPIKVSRMNAVEAENMIEIGNLEREAFFCLDEWAILPREGLDLAFRVGIKQPFLDREGKLSTLLLLFGIPLYNLNNPPSRERLVEEYDFLYHQFESTVIQSIEIYGRITGRLLYPPQYMIDELNEQLGR